MRLESRLERQDPLQDEPLRAELRRLGQLPQPRAEIVDRLSAFPCEKRRRCEIPPPSDRP